MRAGNALWCEKAVPAIGALLSEPAAYRYLPRSYAYLPARDELLALVRGAGFVDVAHHPLSGGITQVVTATRAGAPGLRSRRARPDTATTDDPAAGGAGDAGVAAGAAGATPPAGATRGTA